MRIIGDGGAMKYPDLVEIILTDSRYQFPLLDDAENMSKLITRWKNWIKNGPGKYKSKTFDQFVQAGSMRVPLNSVVRPTLLDEFGKTPKLKELFESVGRFSEKNMAVLEAAYPGLHARIVAGKLFSDNPAANAAVLKILNKNIIGSVTDFQYAGNKILTEIYTEIGKTAKLDELLELSGTGARIIGGKAGSVFDFWLVANAKGLGKGLKIENVVDALAVRKALEIDGIADAERFWKLLGNKKVNDFDQLLRVIQSRKANTMQEIEEILLMNKVANLGHVERVLGINGVENTAQLRRLISHREVTNLTEVENLFIRMNSWDSVTSKAFWNDFEATAEFRRILVSQPDLTQEWKMLTNLGQAAFAADPPWLMRVRLWDAAGVQFSRNGNNLVLLDRNGNQMAEFINRKLLPDQYATSGTPVGDVVNGYRVVDTGNGISIKRTPDTSGYTTAELQQLTQHSNAHVLERHGHDVTDEALIKRAQSPSYAPDGVLRNNAPSNSSKFSSVQRLKDALADTGPGSPSFSPPATGNSFTVTFPPNGISSTRYGYGVPAGGNTFVDMHRVFAVYRKQGGQWKLITMYPIP